MKTVKVVIAIVFFIFIMQACSRVKPPQAQSGVLDLRSWDFEKNGNLPLNGEWEFYGHVFIVPQSFQSGKPAQAAPLMVAVPAPSWTNYQTENGRHFPRHDYATYHLRILLPATAVKKTLSLRMADAATAYSFYWNNQLLFEQGKAGESEETTIPYYKKDVVSVEIENPQVEVVVHVANFHNYKGGLWAPFYVGEQKKIFTSKLLVLSYQFFLFGGLMIMSLYHFCLFYFQRKEWSYLFFALFTFLAAIRILLIGEKFFLFLFPHFGFLSVMRLEYLSYYLIIPIFVWFLYFIFERCYNVYVNTAITVVTAVFTFDVLFSPSQVFTARLPYFQLFNLFSLLFIFYGFIKAVYYREDGSWIALWGTVIFVFLGINELLYLYGVNTLPQTSPVGVYVFIFAQATMLALRYAKAFQKIQNITIDLKKLNLSNERFVPQTMIQVLEKKGIVDVHLGDGVEKYTNILFSDIRNFTSLSENMTPQEIFYFLNLYLQRVGPLIRNKGGFIDKFLGDGIQAVFLENSDDAVQTAILLQKEIFSFNAQNQEKRLPTIQAGVGIHNGMATLGVIGEKTRINTAIFSDSVDIAARLENLTKKFAAPILISEGIKQNLKKTYHLRMLGKMQWHQEKPFGIYEVLDIFSGQELEQKIFLGKLFGEALSAFEKSRFILAKEIFQQILTTDANEKAARYYLSILEKNLTVAKFSSDAEEQLSGG